MRPLPRGASASLPSSSPPSSSPHPSPAAFTGLALVVRLAGAHAASALVASPGLRATADWRARLLPRLARLALPRAAERACVEFSLGAAHVAVSYPVRADAAWPGDGAGDIR